MSAATSPGTGLAYGLRRVCAAWGMARSSFYAMTSGQHAEQPPAKRRGPKPAISDQALLVAIEADLEASPWEGEGYRKVWARLRVCRDIRVARKRVLRLMRENNLLSPHRRRRRGGNPHDGEIITHAPNLMWGTDGVRVFTVDDGWGWIFTAVEHWNAECVGWHVCKRGDRFAALQPISMGLAGLYGSTAAGAARGLALRMDHGSQYLSDHFTNQIVDWNSSMQLVGRTAHVWNSCTHTSANSFLGIFLLTGALCVGPVSAANIASHRGAYELTLQTTSADSDVASVSGGMTFEWIDKCDAWEVKESYLMRVLKQTSSEVNFVAEYFGWESKDGLRYRFQTKRREAGQVKVIRGNAWLTEVGGPGIAEFEERSP